MILAGDALATIPTEVTSIKAFLRQCAEDGIDLASPLGLRVIGIWLESPTDQLCRCKARLATWERLNGKCARCADYERRRLDDALATRTPVAR